jgi:hypothetical protein
VPSPRIQIVEYVDQILEDFYNAIYSWNSDGRRVRGGQLLVKKGGANRAEIVQRLVDGNLVAKGRGDYWRAVFEAETRTRKGRATPEDVSRLKTLEADAI